MGPQGPQGPIGLPGIPGPQGDEGPGFDWFPEPMDRRIMRGCTASEHGVPGWVPRSTASDDTSRALCGDATFKTASAILDGTLTGSPTSHGALLYRGVSAWTALAPGTAGQFLKTAGSSANPAWADGGPIGFQKLTAGTTTYTPTSGTRRALVIVIGAGGGGGGTTGAVTPNAAGGAGGGGGSVCIALMTGVTGTYSCTVGTGGTAGAGPGNGGEGGDSTLTDGANVYTGEGGNGGAGMAAGTAVAYSQAGAGGTVGTAGLFNSSGDPGMYGRRDSGSVASAGKGGSCGIFGGGGLARVAEGDGFAGGGYGSGGGGAVSVDATTHDGGAGADGVIFVLEFP